MSLDNALGLWRKKIVSECANRPLGAETVKVTEALGRVTAGPVFSRISSPFYHSSAMDGYAVRFAETFGATETSPKSLLIDRDALYVNTGDPMPNGFNAVIMVEDVNIADGHIEFIRPVTPWQNVRTVGEDIVATELIAPAHHRIRPVDMGAMLAGGIVDIEVVRRPLVAIIPTGSEVVEPGSDLRVGNIIEFNSTVMGGLVSDWGGQFIRLETVPDDPERLKQAIVNACGMADLVVVNAGASAGTRDYTRPVVEELGELILHGISIRPGKPVMLGWVKSKPFIGVPGYPVSAHVTFNLFAKPLVTGWLGLGHEGPEIVEARLSRQVASPLGQEEFLRMKVGKVGGGFIATPLGRGAGLMMSLVRADGFLRVPEMSEGIGPRQHDGPACQFIEIESSGILPFLRPCGFDGRIDGAKEKRGAHRPDTSS
jgi:putative molybdopterin biosynthesis protein